MKQTAQIRLKLKQKENNDTCFNWNTVKSHNFLKALMIINSPDLMRSFFDDLLTKKELEECARKLQVAEMIIIGTPYININQLTGMGSKNIAKISKRLDHKHSGLNQIMEKLHPRGFHYGD